MGGAFLSMAQYEAYGAAWVHIGDGGSDTAIHFKTSLTRPVSDGEKLLFTFQGMAKDTILDYRVLLTVATASESINESGDKSVLITFSTYQSAAAGNYICLKMVASSGVMEKASFRVNLLRGWEQTNGSLTMPSISTITINTGTNI